MPTVNIQTTRSGTEIKPFYEQKREDLPEKTSSVLDGNNLRIGAGTNVFAIRGDGLIVRSSLSSATVSGFGNGTQVLNQVKVTSLEERGLVAVVERAIYVGTYGDTTKLLPGGSGIDESQFQMIGDYNGIIDSDGSTAQEYELCNQMYIRNISAGNVTLYIDAYVRYILNISGSPSTSQ